MSKSQSIIKVDNLSKEFSSKGRLASGQNGLKAVDEISFKVEKGEIFAFLGPNGAGKTTTIKMIITLLVPTKGTIKVNGFNPLISQSEVRKSLGIVFQDPSLDDELTARENMEFHGVLYGVPNDTRRQRIKKLLKLVELWERRDDFVKNFSGGMKRRLEIARALLHHPKIFFLDEPTLGLDPQTRSKIWTYIKNLNQKEGVTIFFTTHYMEEAEKMAQRMAIIDHGRIIAQGTVDDLKKQTKTNSLEKAFIALTGKTIREEEVRNFDRMRMIRRARMR